MTEQSRETNYIDKEIEDYLVDLALRVAKSKGTDGKELLLSELENWLENHLIASTK